MPKKIVFFGKSFFPNTFLTNLAINVTDIVYVEILRCVNQRLEISINDWKKQQIPDLFNDFSKSNINIKIYLNAYFYI